MPQPKTSSLTPDYRYNETARRYIGSDGRFVSAGAIRGALDTTLQTSRGNVDLICGQLQRGEISVAKWQAAMAQEIKVSHVASASAAKGGWAQMSQSDYGFTGAKIKEQYQYLQNFANEVASGKQPLNGAFLRRARMYNDAARGTYEDVKKREAKKAGAIEERRVRHAADSCIDCIEYEALGWQPIGTLPKIGASICRTNCRCTFEYKNFGGDIV
jgi:hypothetical protein